MFMDRINLPSIPKTMQKNDLAFKRSLDKNTMQIPFLLSKFLQHCDNNFNYK